MIESKINNFTIAAFFENILLHTAETTIGRKNGNPIPKIILGTVGIKPNHSKIRNESGSLFIEPYDKECGEYLFLNGNKVFERKPLNHNDRLVFGTSSFFLVKIPARNTDSAGLDKEAIEYDWEFAQKELMANETKNRVMRDDHDEQVEMKIKILEDQHKKEKDETEFLLKKQQEDYERKIKELEEKSQQDSELLDIVKMNEYSRQHQESLAKIEADRVKKELEQELKKKEIQKEETLKRFKLKEKYYLEQKLSKYLPKLMEINMIAKELKRNIQFSPKLQYFYVDPNELQRSQDKTKKSKIIIQVSNKEIGETYFWSLNKFQSRYYIIKDMLDQYFGTNTLPNLCQDEDPFWDPLEPTLVGQGFYKLASLTFLFDDPTEIPLVGDFQGASLHVNVIPTDATGELNLAEELEKNGEIDFDFDEPRDLIGRRLDFVIKIEYAVLPESLCKDPYVEYTILEEEKSMVSYRTEQFPGISTNPAFNYSKLHHFNDLTETQLNYLTNSYLQLKVYAYPNPKFNRKNSQVKANRDSSLNQSKHKKAKSSAIAPNEGLQIGEFNPLENSSPVGLQKGNNADNKSIPRKKKNYSEAVDVLKNIEIEKDEDEEVIRRSDNLFKQTMKENFKRIEDRAHQESLIMTKEEKNIVSPSQAIYRLSTSAKNKNNESSKAQEKDKSPQKASKNTSNNPSNTNSSNSKCEIF